MQAMLKFSTHAPKAPCSRRGSLLYSGHYRTYSGVLGTPRGAHFWNPLFSQTTHGARCFLTQKSGHRDEVVEIYLSNDVICRTRTCSAVDMICIRRASLTILVLE